MKGLLLIFFGAIVPMFAAEADVPDDTRTFQLRSGTGNCVAAGAGDANNRGMAFSACNANSAQRFFIMPGGNATHGYRIASKEDGKCLRAQVSGNWVGHVSLSGCFEPPNQPHDHIYWDIREIGGQIVLKNRHFNQCLNPTTGTFLSACPPDNGPVPANVGFILQNRHRHFQFSSYPISHSGYWDCEGLAWLSQRPAGMPVWAQEGCGATAPCGSTSSSGGWSPSGLTSFLAGRDEDRVWYRRQCRNIRALACCNAEPFLEAVAEGCAWIRQIHFSGSGGIGRSFVFSCRTAREIYGNNNAERILTIGDESPSVPIPTWTAVNPDTLTGGDGGSHPHQHHHDHTLGRNTVHQFGNGSAPENYTHEEAIEDWEVFQREIEATYSNPLPPPAGGR